MPRIIAGVDEAGRGPLVGDMFVSLVAVSEDDIPKLRAFGVRDSKKLNPERRERLFIDVARLAQAIIVSRVTPSEIDERNINTVFVERVCRCIALAYRRGIEIDIVYVDAAGDPSKTVNRIRACLTRFGIDGVEIVAEHGADARYEIVGAASIVAKVLRDSHIAELHRIYGDFGSGYPSDSRTIEWVKKYYEEHGDLPPIVRRSWSTLEKVLGVRIAKKKSRSLFDYVKRSSVDG